MKKNIEKWVVIVDDRTNFLVNTKSKHDATMKVIDFINTNRELINYHCLESIKVIEIDYEIT